MFSVLTWMFETEKEGFELLRLWGVNVYKKLKMFYFNSEAPELVRHSSVSDLSFFIKMYRY